jgi:5-methylcytosine-specific restriction protein A
VLQATEVDHRIPKSESGTDSPDNLCAINADCHKRKTAKESARARAKAKP